MAQRTILTAIALGLLVSGCARNPEPKIITKVEIVEVKVPVPVKVQPPVELLEPIEAPLPEFVSPDDKNASSALTAEGERLLRGLIEELLQRIKMWEFWASQKLE